MKYTIGRQNKKVVIHKNGNKLLVRNLKSIKQAIEWLRANDPEYTK